MQGCAGEEVVYVGETVGSLRVDLEYKCDLFGATFEDNLMLAKSLPSASSPMEMF